MKLMMWTYQLPTARQYGHLEQGSASTKQYFHGTHFQCLESILREGHLKPSNDARIDEFTKPGIYTSAELLTAEYHGTRLRIWKQGEHVNQSSRLKPFAQLVFEGRPVNHYVPKTWSYGRGCTQSVFPEQENYQLLQLHVLFGLPFEDKGCHYNEALLPEYGFELKYLLRAETS